MEIIKYGESACLVRGKGPNWCAMLEAALSSTPPVDFLEFVRGYDNLLLIFNSPAGLEAVSPWLAALPAVVLGQPAGGREIEIGVRYNGPDLTQVAQWAGMNEAEVVALHSGAEYTVRMMGFMPGFPYLDGLDPRLHFERRASPRNYIAEGSVAIGGAHAGIYSVGSPGGWHLLGQTEQSLFAPVHAQGASIDAEQVFALQPGDRIRFIPID